MQRPHKKFDYRMPQLWHEALLASPHRTSLAAEADYFYVPTWDFHGSWGNPEVQTLASIPPPSANPSPIP